MRPYRIHGALFAVNLLFAINYIVSKLGMSSFDPITFAYLRVLGAAIFLNFWRAADMPPFSPASLSLLESGWRAGPHELHKPEPEPVPEPVPVPGFSGLGARVYLLRSGVIVRIA